MITVLELLPFVCIGIAVIDAWVTHFIERKK